MPRRSAERTSPAVPAAECARADALPVAARRAPLILLRQRVERRALRLLDAIAAFQCPPPPDIDSRVGPRRRIAGAWPAYRVAFGAAVFALVDVSEEGFRLRLDIESGGPIEAPDEGQATVRRADQLRASGFARRVWRSDREAGYRFITVDGAPARTGPEPLLAGRESADRLRRRLRL